jgi:hypothetical protein
MAGGCARSSGETASPVTGQLPDKCIAARHPVDSPPLRLVRIARSGRCGRT